MRRSLWHSVSIQVDQNGHILETECECAAGMGPSACRKHIQAALLALVDFTSGKPPKLEQTCTVQLQSFHKPRHLHTGSPVQARNLKMRRKPLESLNFDPHPVKFWKMPGYPDFVRNLTLNFAVNSGNHIPLLQTVQPAKHVWSGP